VTGRGKVILLGEHAVVYGHPAVAGALDRGVTAQVAPARGASELTVPRWNLRATAGDGTVPGRALAALLAAVDQVAPVAITAAPALPPGAGLGSSAALSVAIARALLARPDAATVERAAHAAEAVFHHNPSGIDVALAARGGLGVFRRRDGFTPVAAPTLRLAVGLTGQPRSTATMVRNVAQAIEGDPTQRAWLDRLGGLAEAGIDAVTQGQWPELGRLLGQAQLALGALGLSTTAIDTLVDIALAAGALGAKLTGAGGGGAVIALAPGREDAIVAAWQARGYDGFVSTIGATP
jgi:mevalonate kinase